MNVGGINSGWSNNCGLELFSIGWIKCAEPEISLPGGGSSTIYAQAKREDEEILTVIHALVEKLM